MESLSDWLNRTNEKLNILYVYGWNSGPDSSTYKSLKKYLGPKFNVYCNRYSQMDPELGLKQLNKYVDTLNIDIVIGTSLGGFFTALIKNVSKVMINPALHPSMEISGLGLDNQKAIKQYETLEKTLKSSIDAEERSCAYGLFGSKDKVINDKADFDKIYNNSKIIPVEHHLSDSDIKNYLVPFIFDTVLTSRQRRIANESLQQFNELITERFVNLHTSSDKLKYADEVWNILQRTYAGIGGMAGMRDVQQLIDETDMWKLVRRSGKIVAVAAYTNKRGGRKLCYAGQDGTEQGKSDLFKIMTEDNKMLDRQAWTECSGAVVSSELKAGAFPIPASKAQEIMHDKVFYEIKPDGYFYIRKIGADLHTKIMLGHYKDYEVEQNPEQIKELKELAKKYSKEDEERNS